MAMLIRTDPRTGRVAPARQETKTPWRALAAIFIGAALLVTAACAPNAPPPQTAPRPPARVSSRPPAKPPAKAPAATQRPYQVAGQWYHPMANADAGWSQQGKASWYGKKFHGRKTASGETYNMYAMTAAHKTLPLQSVVRVRNMDNGREIDVRVNDRGPFVRGRIIDLSYSAAKELAVVGPGTAPVEITVLGKRQPGGGLAPVNPKTGNFTVQVGAFTDPNNAKRFAEKLGRTYTNAHVTEFFDGIRTFYRVRVGYTHTLAQAEAFEARMIRDGYTDAFAIAE